jgi:hypothetical protein
MMPQADRELYAAAAALLGQGERLDRLSGLLTLAGLVALAALPSPVLPILVVLAGLGQAYLSIRTGFDAALFAALAKGQGLEDAAAMDRALLGLALMPAAKAGRPAALRIAGARRLLHGQASLVLVQVGLAIAGAGIQG